MDDTKLKLESIIINNDEVKNNIKQILCKNFVIQCLMKLIEINKSNESDKDIILEFNYDINSLLKFINFGDNKQIIGNTNTDMNYKFINITKVKQDFNNCRYALLYKLFDHQNRDIKDKYDEDFKSFKNYIDDLNKYDNYFDEFLNMIHFINLNQKFVILKHENNIAGYAIVNDTHINYPIILQEYQKEGDVLFEFNKLIIKENGKKQIISPHNLNEAGFHYDYKL